MKIVAINGSPKGENGNTSFIVDNFLSVFEEKSYKTSHIVLNKYNICKCEGCFDCFIKTPGVCKIKDDFSEVFNEVMDADYLIFATPVYFGCVSSLMKCFVERMISLCDPEIRVGADGKSFQRICLSRVPQLIIVSNCALVDNDNFDIVSLFFNKFSKFLGSNVIAEIYRTQGELLTLKSAFIKPLISIYAKNIKKAALEIIEDNLISEKISKKLSKPIIPNAKYISLANEYYKKRLKI